MSDIKFNFLGWCKEDNHDKIWCRINCGGSHYAVWGRRGKTLTFKKHARESNLIDVQRTKVSRYREVDSFEMFMLFPDLEEDIQQQLMFAILADKVK